MAKHIFIVAGEKSGDLHGANLASCLREISSDLKLSGLGGERMRQAGVDIYQDLVSIATVGFSEVLKNLGKFRAAFKQLLARARQIRPDAVVLIDYPGFNLRVAPQLKRLEIPIIYYISPQVWAWGRGRIRLIKKLVNKVVVIFEFEKKLYENYGVEAEFVGHPLLDVVRPSLDRAEAMERFNLVEGKPIVALLPGSRETEVRRLLKPMIEAAREIHRQLPQTQFLVVKSEGLSDACFGELASDIPLSVVEGQSYDCLNVSTFALVASGTATLETAIMGVPMIILYKISLASWFLLRPVIKIPYIGLANIVAGKKLFPEFLQFDITPEKIAQQAVDLLKDEERIENIKRELTNLRGRLGSPGASKRAAECIYNFIQTRS